MEENENKLPDIPYFIFEGEMARLEARLNRVSLITVILAALLLVSNIYWIIRAFA